MGIPFLVEVVAQPLSAFTFQLVAWNSYTHPVVGSLARLILLSVFYHLWIRHLDREFLVSLWGYLITATAIGFIANLILYVIVMMYGTMNAVYLVGILSISLFIELPLYLALLWFARKLTRTGLSYAFFLVVFTSLNLIVLPATVPAEPAMRSAFIISIISIVAAPWIPLIKVWLLGNFERRDERFRRTAIIVLAVALVLDKYVRIIAGTVLGALESPFYTVFPIPFLDLTFWNMAAFIVAFTFNAVSLFLLFGVVYLIRVRKDVGSNDS